MICAWKETFGFDCLMCGFQRSFSLLFEGEFIASIKMYPPLIPLLFVVVFAFMHLLFKFKNGHRLIVITFSLSALLMAVNFGVKWYHGTIFH